MNRPADVCAVPLPLSPSSAPYAVLAAVCLAGLVLPLSFAAVAMATPAIARDLGGSPVALNWITNAFMLTFGSSLMAAGTLADEFGRKRLFTLGIALFSLTSLALMWAPSVLWLDLLRALQGFAAAGALAGGSAALAQAFDGPARTRAFSLLGTTFGLGLAFGPVLAGVLIEHYGWRSIFLSTTVIGVLSLLFGVPRMQESRDPDAAGVDWPGTLSFTATLVLLTWGVLQAPQSGWLSAPVLGLLSGAVVLLAVFIVVEWRATRPMLDLSLFRYPRFVGVQVLPIATCYCFVVLLVLLPIRFIGIEGHSEVEAGVMMIALSAPMLVVPFLAAVLTRWISAGVLCGAGLLIAAVGLYLLSRIAPGQAPDDYLPALITIGVGAGLPWGLMDGLSMSVVPRERAGMATGIFSTTRVAGEGIALALVGALMAGLVQVALPGAQSAAQLLASGNVQAAHGLLPQVGEQQLVQVFGEAFANLMDVMIAITVLSAVVVLAFLRDPDPV